MRMWIKASRGWVIQSAYLGFAVCVVLAGSGCASTQKTTTTTTTATIEERPGSAIVGVGGQRDSAALQQTESTIETTETEASNPGLLSSTVHAIGWVIALPFRLVGGLIRWIF